jgi:hypothetical protein
MRTVNTLGRNHKPPPRIQNPEKLSKLSSYWSQMSLLLDRSSSSGKWAQEEFLWGEIYSIRPWQLSTSDRTKPGRWGQWTHSAVITNLPPGYDNPERLSKLPSARSQPAFIGGPLPRLSLVVKQETLTWPVLGDQAPNKSQLPLVRQETSAIPVLGEDRSQDIKHDGFLISLRQPCANNNNITHSIYEDTYKEEQ